jgi:hypothetical protein
MSAIIDTIDPSYMVLDYLVDSSSPTSSSTRRPLKTLSSEEYAIAAFSILQLSNISTDTVLVTSLHHEGSDSGTKGTDLRTERDLGLAEWLQSAREALVMGRLVNESQVFSLGEPAQGDFMPYLERSLRGLKTLPARVKASVLFENEISDAALVSATGFLKRLGMVIIGAGYDWREPYLSTEDRGDVSFAWRHNDKSLFVSVTESDVHYLRVWGPNIHTEMDEGINPTNDDLVELWRWLYDRHYYV